MFKAMQAGRGSLSTTHAESARDAIERLATCALEAGAHITEAYAYRQIAQHIDLVVQVAVTDHTATGGAKHRYVAEVVHLAWLLRPLSGHVHMFTPSPAGYTEPGLHCEADDGELVVGHAIRVHRDWFLRPLQAQVQVLHPSAAR